MRGKKLQILSEDEAGLLFRLPLRSLAIFLSLITNYIFHNEYLKLTLFWKIFYILHFITHSLTCELKYLLFVTYVKAMKTNTFLIR